MLRQRAFWISFVILSLASAIFTFRNFSTAFPLVAIDLHMDRGAAMRQARSLAQMYDWPGPGFDQAAEFSANQEVQNFIELEGGGKPELGRILKQKIFAPYTWRVRFFKQGDAHETLVRFTPEGEPYGFRVKLPDQEKGASTAVAEAERIAEDTARDSWKIDFSRYRQIESSRDVRLGGRVDHTFVFERQDERVGDGRYRLRLVVSGDKLTELTHFVQIPEAFTRRYEQMRSANEAINTADSVVVFGVYILGFCGIGLFFMMRRRWIVWRTAVRWAILIALLMALQQLNSWPLVWMNYDTAVPASGFATRQILGAFGVFTAFALLLTVSFAAAETLTRRAFPNHIQLWKAWSKPVASSRPMLGQTLAGYLLVAPFFAYEIILYFFAQGKLGWWTPSDTLVNPDMFANYVPSLSAISMAAQAGFWEECLFRAAPLATAALIGEKLGKRRLCIGIALLVQAIVFGAGHAGYANQPAYARVVELIIPSFAFGTLYLLFGLLPGIVLHFSYDTVWMALPLFVSSGTRAHVEQGLIIVAALIPAWVVLVNQIRSTARREVPEEALNRAWRPSEVVQTAPAIARPIAAPTSIPSYVLRGLPIAGIAGLIVWLFGSSFRTDAPPVNLSRAAAEQNAREALARRGIQLDSSWKVLGYVEGQPGEINRFVWQTAGRDVYRKLLGVYVTPPSWVIRFARFEGDVAERAEEYHVYIRNDGVFRISHELPEARPGKHLTENEAQVLAVSVLDDATNFEEVSAQAAKRPARTDWTFVFKDKRTYGLLQGEPRISIGIAGDEVADSVRYVYVPEEWTRNERARRNLPGIFSVLCTILIVAIAAAGAITGAVHWSRGRAFSSRAFITVFAAVFLVGVLNVGNNWPVFMARAVTAQPLLLQVGIMIATSLLFGMFSAAGMGLIAGLVATDLEASRKLPISRTIPVSISLGFAVAAVGTMARNLTPPTIPDWGSLGPASTFLPFVGAALAPLTLFLTQTMILLTVLFALGRRRQAAVVWLVVGIAIAGSSSIETIPSWLIVGLVTGLALAVAYALVFRHQPELFPPTIAMLVVLTAIRDGMERMFPWALSGYLAAAGLIGLVVWAWFRGSMKEPLRG